MRALTDAPERLLGLPPHGGSGLKCKGDMILVEGSLSPSTRREWIEIGNTDAKHAACPVSLHTEGVD